MIGKLKLLLLRLCVSLRWMVSEFEQVEKNGVFAMGDKICWK